jgi:hypothetical protein
MYAGEAECGSFSGNPVSTTPASMFVFNNINVACCYSAAVAPPENVKGIAEFAGETLA